MAKGRVKEGGVKFDLSRQGSHDQVKAIRTVERGEVVGMHERLNNARAIPLDKISPDPDQPRRNYDQAQLDELAQSLESDGQLQAIRVFRVPGVDGDRYTIHLGERRYRCAKQLGWKTIDCIVVKESVPRTERLIQQYNENQKRSGLLPSECANTYQELMELNGWSLTELAQKINTSKANISKALSFLKLSVEEQHLARDLGIREVYEVSKVDEPTKRRELIRAFQSHEVSAASVSKARARQSAPPRTARKKTIDGLQIRISSEVSFSNSEIAKRLRKFADQLEKDKRAARSSAA